MSRRPTLVFVGLTVLAVALAVEIEDCTQSEELGQYVEAAVSGCTEEDEKCPLRRGHNVTLVLKFKANKEIESVRHVVHGILPAVPVPVPFPLATTDACEGTGLKCPLTVGEHTYQYDLPVKTSYPKLSVNVKWELQDKDKKQIVCIQIPAILK